MNSKFGVRNTRSKANHSLFNWCERHNACTAKTIEAVASAGGHGKACWRASSG